MSQKPKIPRDGNQLAKFVVDVATGEREADINSVPVNEFARAGGLKGGKARAERLSPERRRQIAKSAAEARWRSNRNQ
ncbi:MAG: histone H1 [Nitrospinae bacterium]|nr:histone H1 [Nitrospinota bacterium]